MPHRPRVLALVLAGGKGSRLGPLTQRRAKPALPFAGVYRLIDFPLTNCVHAHLSDVWVVEQYRPHALNDHLLNGRPWDLDRNRGGLRVMPPFTGAHGEGFAEGNADALWRHRALLAEFGADELVVLSADHVWRLDLRDVLDAHRAAGASVTMVTHDVGHARARRHGVVRLTEGGRVAGFQYKPDAPASGTVTTEAFVYDARTLLATLDRLHADVVARGDDEHLGDFGDHLLPALVEAGRAHAVPQPGYWRDVGTVGAYWAGHRDLLGDEPALALDDPAWPIRTAGVLRLPARAARGAELEDALLAPGARVAGRVVRSVLGPGVVVEAGAEVIDSVLLDDVVVRAGARVAHAVLDERVEVGREARVGGAHAADARRASPGVPTDAAEPPDEAFVVVGAGRRIDDGAAVAPGARLDAERGGED